MALILYGHPFSSYTQKVLVALYENGTAYEFRCIGPETPQHTTEWLRRWPLHKFPLLVDGDRNVSESSIIIEYLQLRYPGPVPLLPADVRLKHKTRCVRQGVNMKSDKSGPQETTGADYSFATD